MKKRILFRVDGGDIPEIGMGHLTRCLILADALQRQSGTEVAFATRELPVAVKLIQNLGFRLFPLTEPENESLEVLEALVDFNPDIVVVDRLGAPAKLMALIKKTGVILIGIDECGEGRRHADFLINPILSHADALYQGYDYMVLPEERESATGTKRNNVPKKVFASFGGYDHRNFTAQVVEVLEPWKTSCEVHVAVPETYPDFDSLAQRFGNLNRFHFYRNPKNFNELLSSSDVALISGGLTLFQAVAHGVPSVVLPQYAHQVKNARQLEKMGAGVFVCDNEKPAAIQEKLEPLIEDETFRKQFSNASRRLIDGLGTKRVVDLIGIINRLDWDSDFFGKNIAFLTPKRIRENILRFALKKCEEGNIDCLYYLCDCHDALSVNLVEKYGFHFVDIRMTFQIELAKSRWVEHGSSVYQATETDIAALQEIAASNYEQSRYFFDRHFSKDDCKKFYSDWVTKSVHGKFDDLVFAAKDAHGKVLGFICCRKVSHNLGRIGLIGVRSDTQGQGIGRLLVARAFNWFHEQDLPLVEVITQGRNVPAQQFYQKCGFKIVRTELWYHKWFKKQYLVDDGT